MGKKKRGKNPKAGTVALDFKATTRQLSNDENGQNLCTLLSDLSTDKVTLKESSIKTNLETMLNQYNLRYVLLENYLLSLTKTLLNQPRYELTSGDKNTLYCLLISFFSKKQSVIIDCKLTAFMRLVTTHLISICGDLNYYDSSGQRSIQPPESYPQAIQLLVIIHRLYLTLGILIKLYKQRYPQEQTHCSEKPDKTGEYRVSTRSIDHLTIIRDTLLPFFKISTIMEIPDRNPHMLLTIRSLQASYEFISTAPTALISIDLNLLRIAQDRDNQNNSPAGTDRPNTDHSSPELKEAPKPLPRSPYELPLPDKLPTELSPHAPCPANAQQRINQLHISLPQLAHGLFQQLERQVLGHAPAQRPPDTTAKNTGPSK